MFVSFVVSSSFPSSSKPLILFPALCMSGWASTAIAFRTLLDGSTHIATGISFAKIPDKPYHAQGQKMTWRLMAANIINQ